MLLTITTTSPPASQIGYLLHKHPDKHQSFNFNYGKIHVFYPQANEEICSVCVLLDVNPIEIIKNRKSSHEFLLKQYVNDRPFVASSLMSVAIAKVFSSALNGKCEAFPEKVQQKIALRAELSIVASRGENLLNRLFSPLGYQVCATPVALDEKFPEWGMSDYYTLTIEHTITLRELLSHLYILIPVLDDEKHYWVGTDEINKLLEKSGDWLKNHPEREFITRRYLRHHKGLVYEALERLVEQEAEAVEPVVNETLHQKRLQQVFDEIKKTEAKNVLDLGCGSGKLLELLLRDRSFEKIVGMDVSHQALEQAKRQLFFDEMAPRQRERVQLIHGSLIYKDRRLCGYETAAIVEVIEHLDVPRLKTFEKNIFGFAQPQTVIITTPNQEYNSVFEMQQEMRHEDHRFEWTRQQFRQWAEEVATTYGYTVRFSGVGEEHQQVGPPCQMGVFTIKWK